MWEITLSAHLLQNREGMVTFRSWRRYAHRHLGTWARLVVTLAPDARYFPDFLTPAEGTSSVEEGIDTLLSTPRGRLRDELATLAAVKALPGWCHRWATGDAETARGVRSAFYTFYQTLIAPFWDVIQSEFAAERARGSHAFLNDGLDGLLNGIGPALRWRPPILEADYPIDQDLYLNGGGLLLVPSFFCWRTPVTLADPELLPVLVYPVAHRLGITPADSGAPSADRPLAALLGTTRAAVLRAINEGCTTTELSRRTGTSMASASQHASVLRDARLIVTRRHRNTVIHTLTPLGAALTAKTPLA